MANFVLSVVLVSAAGYHFIETPARKYINRLADGPGMARRAVSRARPALT